MVAPRFHVVSRTCFVTMVQTILATLRKMHRDTRTPRRKAGQLAEINAVVTGWLRCRTNSGSDAGE
jgi:hypothetical protein